MTGFSFASYRGIGERPCPTSGFSSTCSHGGLPPLSLVLSSPAALVMWTQTLSELISLSCPQRLVAASCQVRQQLWFCRFPVPLPSELPLGVSAEHCKGTQACDSLPSAAGGRNWQPRQAQQKVASGPIEAWRRACGGLPAAVSSSLGGTVLTLHGFAALHRNAAWGGVREKVARARHMCNHGTSHGMLCLILLLKANPSQKDP